LLLRYSAVLNPVGGGGGGGAGGGEGGGTGCGVGVVATLPPPPPQPPSIASAESVQPVIISRRNLSIFICIPTQTTRESHSYNRVARRLTELPDKALPANARAMPPLLSSIDTWIFDLDNTLYPARCDLFELIDERMGLYVAQLHGVDALEARRIQKAHFHEHGTTLSGLMTTHEIDPHEFLGFVHDIPLDRLTPNPALAASLAALPGRKLVFTNGDADYAARVLAALGLADSFDGLHDIHASRYRPKPDPACYAAMIEALDVNPRTALFAEDMVRNLVPAKALGMATLWVNNGSEQCEGAETRHFVDFEVENVSDWLAEITGELVG
jgi:putative hydrolase of the HAD superfamily